MPFESGAFVVGKLADVVLALAKEPILTNEHVVRVLKRFGYVRLKDDFASLYVHAVVLRRRDGAPGPLLKLFRHQDVVEAFHRAWEQGSREPFDEKARWAVQTFREGDEVRGLGVDVEEEVRKFFDTFNELAQQARTPGDQQTHQLIAEIHEKVVQRSPPEVPVLPSDAERFQRDLGEWLEACGYVIDGPASWLSDEVTFDLVVSRPRRRGRDRFLIRGFQGVADAGQFHELPDPAERRVDESWLVSPIEVTAAARSQADRETKDRFVYTFDDLIDQEVRFNKYEAYLTNEVVRRRLPEYYVPLGCRKPELDRQGVTRGEGLYDEMAEYVGQWLDQPIREHISVLGEFGTGKTWFTLRLAYVRLQEYHQARQKKRPRGRYPLLIQLRDYAKAVSVESLLSEFFFDRYEVGLPSMKAFKILNRMGRFLLIFDGFDEMARKVDYQKVVDNFWELAKAVVPGAKAVLTCREEHFRYAREAREVLAGHEMASTDKIVLVPPRFDVAHIEPFDEPRIRRAIVARQGEPEGNRTADLVLGHRALADLAKRPVMIEMVLDSLEDIKGRESLATSQVYLYATDAQMRRNIKEERTFTSMTDKVLFLCELAWEMHRTEELKINYKLFPARIRDLFGEKVAAEEKDHWHFDLMGQTLLVRDEDGNYGFAHRGLAEYFSAYRLLAQAGALGEEFAERYHEVDNGASAAEAMSRSDPADLLDSWGAAPFHPNLVTFLAEMASGAQDLRRLIDWTKGRSEERVGYVGGNAASVLVQIDAAALEGADVAGSSLRGGRLAGARLGGVKARGSDLRDADLMAADLTASDLRKARLEGALLRGLNCASTLASDASGELLFGGPRSGGWVYDLRTRKFLDVYGGLGEAWTCDRAVSSDGRWLAHAGGTEIRIGEVDRDRGGVRWTVGPTEGGEFSYLGVAWHPEGWFLVLDHMVGVLRVEPGPTVRVTKLEGLAFEVSEGPGVVVRPPWWIIGGLKRTTVWDEKRRQVVAVLDAEATVGERPEVSPSGRFVSIANEQGLSVFETDGWERIGYVKGYSACAAHGWSPAGDRLAFCAIPDVLVVDPVDLSIVSRLTPPEWARGVTFHGPEELVVVGGRGTIHLYDLKTGNLIHSAPQVPLCRKADLRGASGLDDRTRKALAKAGARV